MLNNQQKNNIEKIKKILLETKGNLSIIANIFDSNESDEGEDDEKVLEVLTELTPENIDSKIEFVIVQDSQLDFFIEGIGGCGYANGLFFDPEADEGFKEYEKISLCGFDYD